MCDFKKRYKLKKIIGKGNYAMVFLRRIEYLLYLIGALREEFNQRTEVRC